MSYPSSPQEPSAPSGGASYPAGPAQPYSSYPEPPAPVAPKKSKALKIVLIVLVSVLVLCGAGVAIVWATVGDEVGEAIEASQTRLVAPETLAGRPKITEPDMQGAADEMVTSLKADVPEATSTIGAFYGNVEEQDILMIAGASGVFADPDQELADAVSETADMNLTNIKTVDAGPLGGSAKCADGGVDDVEIGYCAWADKGSVGIIVLYFSTGAEAAAELVGIRGEVQQKV